MSESEQSGAGRREVAYRLFAAEYDDADFSYSESDEERAPNYVITPTGARINRLFVVGVLTEVEQVSDDVLRARVVDPTGAFVLYAGQYQPDEQAFLERAEPPTFVAVTGKARTFTPDDSDQVFTSVRPESINEVDAETRDRWTVQAAEQTLQRVGYMATALETGLEGEELRQELVDRGVDDGLASGIVLARDHYGTTPAYLDALRTVAVEAARVVAGEADEVAGLDVSPAVAGDVSLTDLQTAGIDPNALRTREGAAPETAERVEESVETTPETDETEQEAADTTEEQDTVELDAETAESSPDDETAAAASGELGDFEPGEFDGEEFELEAETREQIEEEYGTEFQSGTEVDEPGEADIETPTVEPGDVTDHPEQEVETGARQSDPEAGTSDEGAPSETERVSETSESEETAQEERAQEETDAAESLASDDEIAAAVVNVLQELNDGSGVARDDLQSTMTERYDVTESAVDDAIQDALMDGKCWEPDDETLMPI